MGRRNHSFKVTVNHKGHTLFCTGEISPGYPGKGPSMDNAGGEPAEPPEIEDMEIYLVHEIKNGEKKRLLEDPQGKLFEAIYENVMEAASEYDDTLEAMDADAKNKARRENGI